MQRRDFILTSLATAATPLIPGLASAQDSAQASSSMAGSSSMSAPPGSPGTDRGIYSPTNGQYYSRDEIVAAGSNFLGVTVEALGGALEKIFADFGDHPTAYIAGEEASAALAVGVRYGKGNLFMKSQPTPTYIYWQGPSIGFDTGANASRVFTLAYNLHDPDMIWRRYPGVEGSAYFIGGLGVTYQRAEGIVLTPIRAGLGFRLGANVGYMNVSKHRRILPL
jgi:hypothetical protein